MNMLNHKNLGVAKLALTVVAATTIATTFRPATAQAAPVCGPAEAVRVANAYCETIKPSWKDALIGVIVPGLGVTKAALYAGCKSLANSGYLVDLLYGNCCKAHDACYTRGGDLSCKNKCDLDFYACTRSGLSGILGGTGIAEAVVSAATVGGFGTFTYNDNTCR
jgi:hypothetical protein